jgi:hypothetical protein
MSHGWTAHSSHEPICHTCMLPPIFTYNLTHETWHDTSDHKMHFLLNVKLIRYQFWCTRCASRLLKSPQWYSGRKSWKSEKKNMKTV